MKTSRVLAAIFFAGVAFFYIDTFLVGFAAAVAAPNWVADLMAKYPRLGLALWDVVTVVPATIISSLMVGLVLAKLIDRFYFVAGLFAVVIALLLVTLTVPTDQGPLVELRNNALPHFWFQAPMALTVWLSLPLATLFFGHRERRSHDGAAGVVV